MNDYKLVISEYYDLLNLHKALLEAKFNSNPDNEYIAGSPIVAKISNEIIELLRIYDLKKKGKEDWSEWRKISNQELYMNRAIDKIVRFGEWENLDYEEKKEKIYNYLSPFCCSEDEIRYIMHEIDKKLFDSSKE